VSEAAAVAELIDRARAAQPAWDALGFEGRGEILLRTRAWLTAHADEVVATIVAETGKTYEDALLGEVAYAARACRFWAERAPGYLAAERIGGGRRRRLEVRRAPLGVVGVIAPANFPLTNGFGDALPALAAGNAVVLKPSPLTPRTSLLMGRVLAGCGLPSGVFAVAQGGAAAGEALVDGADFVAFTGSTATGRRVAERAGRELTPVSLELGGNDAMLVLADADLDRAANLAAYYGTFHGGRRASPSSASTSTRPSTTPSSRA
jgi:acyl-CoA reductase-like NAD-dependent aldehyde dehydrogenase